MVVSKAFVMEKKQNILKNSDVSLSFTQTYIHTNFCLQQNVILDLEILSKKLLLKAQCHFSPQIALLGKNTLLKYFLLTC